MTSTPLRTSPAEMVTDCGERAAAAAPAMAAATDGQIDAALRGMATCCSAAPTLRRRTRPTSPSRWAAGLEALVDRLRLGEERLTMGGSLTASPRSRRARDPSSKGGPTD